MQTKDHFRNAKTQLVCFPSTFFLDITEDVFQQNKTGNQRGGAHGSIQGKTKMTRSSRRTTRSWEGQQSCRIESPREGDEEKQKKTFWNRKTRTQWVSRKYWLHDCFSHSSLRFYPHIPLNTLQLRNLCFEVMFLYGLGLKRRMYKDVDMAPCHTI